jgi:hypothetical protein
MMEYMSVDDMLHGGDMAWPSAPQTAPSPGVHELGHAEPFTPPARQGVEHATPPSASPDLDVDVDDAPRHYRRMMDILRTAPMVVLADRQIT